MNTNLAKIKEEINLQIADKDTFKTLLDTTFKGIKDPAVAKRAMLEGMMRGFEFKDFLQKNIYAIPFKESYALVTSIDHARKIGMRSGVCGKSEPIFEEKDNKIISCKITIKRNVGSIVGEYTAKVYFDEYFKKGQGYKSLWETKPRTMLAKVAEMHALRSACPEELSQAYVEEEMEKEGVIDVVPQDVIDKVSKAKTLDELKTIYKENEGFGKGFSKMVMEKKIEIGKLEKESENENGNS